MRKLHLLALALVLATASSAMAQGTGSLTGTVYDQTKAAVPGATVTATHQATNVSYTTQSTGAGLYRFPSLPVGAYTIKVQVAGFRVVVLDNVVISVGQTASEDITLEVGAVTETVTVEGGGLQLVQTSDTSVSGLVDATTLSLLPLEIREPSSFVNLMPGTVDGDTITAAIGTVSRGPAVHGSRSGTGNFTVDGFDNNDQGQGGRGGSGGSLGAPGAQVGISPEAIQEFRVITSNFDAQSGRAGGFVSTVTLKSGTNSLHGSLFEYNRVQKLAANSWASNRADLDDRLVRNQFGGSLGGPIRKDKTFAFGSVELHRMRTQSPTTVTSVTPEFINFVKSGQFADFMESDPNGLCNNQTAYNNLFDNIGFGTDLDADGEADVPATAPGPCPGAFSLSSTLGPVMGPLVDQFGFPVPTSDFTNEAGGLITGPAGIVYPVNVYGTAAGADTGILNQNRISLKFDHNASDKDRFSGTFLFDDLDQFGSFGGDYFNPAFPFENPGRNQIWGLSYTRTFSPTVVNEFRIGYLRDRADFPELLQPDVPSIIPLGFDPLTTQMGRTSGLPQFFTNNQFQYQDSLSIITGNHTFKVGVEYRRTRNGSAFEALKNGEFDMNDIESMLTDGAFGDESDLLVDTSLICGVPCGGGLGVAAINPLTGQLPEFYRGYRANEFGAYVQDSWKIHPRFTANLGLRWEYQGPPHNFREGLDSNFFAGSALLPSSWTSCDATIDGTENPFFPCDSLVLRRTANGQFVQKDKNIWSKDTNNFAPRVGFAWDVKGDQKLVLRWGGGVFYDRIWNNLFENIRFNPPFHAFAGTGALFDGTPVGPLSLPGFFSFPINPTFFASSGAASPRHMDENLVLPYIEQYFFGVQYQFTSDMALHVTYTSTLGRKLTGLLDLNTFPGRTAGIGSSARPNTSIGSDNSRTNAFKSNYHGLEAQLLRRFSRGLQFQANYTYSKAIDEISDAFSSKDSLRPTDNFDIKLDRGRADFDIAHRFVTSLYYEIPFMNENRWLGGWSTGGIVTIRQGTPFSALCACDSNRDGFTSDRANFVGTGSIQSLINHSVSPADGYLTATDSNGDKLFTATPTDPAKNQGAWINGSLGRNIFTGPGAADVTWTINKKFRIRETSAVQFQANFFNLFNHPNFLLPTQTITSGSFGKSTNTFAPRVIQLALRFDF